MRTAAGRELMALVDLLAPVKGPRARRERRYADMRRLGTEMARSDFESRYPSRDFAPVVVLIASYLEADNI
ncbi:MAG: hypothetical protein ACRD0B_09630, partial [Acidimicrobiales bacterium]